MPIPAVEVRRAAPGRNVMESSPERPACGGGGRAPPRAPLGCAGERHPAAWACRRGRAPPAVRMSSRGCAWDAAAVAQMSSTRGAGDAAAAGSAFPIAAEAEEAVWGRHGNCRRRR